MCCPCSSKIAQDCVVMHASRLGCSGCHVFKRLCTVTAALLLQISMSNWEARHLDSQQVHYAALDALVTGQVFRGLRLWHSAPSACATCHQTLGEALPKPDLFCMHPNCRSRTFGSLPSLESHTNKAAHSPSVARCLECGRLHQKPSL